ncbi:histidine kinase [Pedobacter sp. HDW13]|uniref:sensor histidine kinase n=1 Tax=Pedobacter sp. HDW13 TaxID=2714940 RepID=UPI00140A4174|nr:histidine kinase [Pedobacter sp. HDW13]QIL40404.1 histidine kinase [Pedobacter sp. HDW13]
MPIATETFLSNKTRRILFLFCAFVLYYLVSFLIDPYAKFWQNYFQRSHLDIAAEWLITFLFCFLVAEATIVIHNKLNKRIPWTKKPGKRLFIETLLNIAVVFAVILLNVICMYLIYNKTEAAEQLSIEDIRNLLQWIIVSLVIAFIIMGVNTGSYMVNNWKNSELEVTEQKLRVSELRQASVEAELNALKLQLDPHFIFNNLSVLSELILEDQALGYKYSENFAKVYRFLLLNSKKDLIPLEEELKFLRSYIFLTEQRIGSGVSFNIAVDQSANQLLIPPLTLQLLIENAIKHNRTGKNNPLEINIYSTLKDNLVVENKLIPLEHPIGGSTGIGLANIIRRFSLLAKQTPTVTANEGSFKVTIHLIANDQ